MKKILYISLIFISYLCHGQSWNPKTAYWIYKARFFLFTEGDIRLSFLKDTLVNDEICQMMGLEIIEYNYLDKKYRYKKYGQEITYHKSGVTYILNGNQFDTLYYFSANIGDKYKITGRLSQTGDSGYATVIDTGRMVINSSYLKWLAIDYKFFRKNWEHSIRDTIIEKIGSTKLYYLPWDIINGMVDGNRGGSIKCYFDPSLGVYTKNNSGNCTFDISLNTSSINIAENINIFPNPADHMIMINASDYLEGSKMVIYSASGQIIESRILDINNQIDTKEWKEGLYLIMIQNKWGIKKQKIIISR